MKLSYEDLQEHMELLLSVKEGRYPHGLDLRPLTYQIRNRRVLVAVTNVGILAMRLSKDGETALASGLALLGQTRS